MQETLNYSESVYLIVESPSQNKYIVSIAIRT